MCIECDGEMIDDTNLHTDYVGGISFEEQIYLSYIDGAAASKDLVEKENGQGNYFTKRVKARVCPKCGEVELYVDNNK